MNRKVLLSSFLVSVLLLSAMFGILSVRVVAADSGETEPVYVEIAKYYDNRKCVVTSTDDDFGAFNISYNEKCLSMLTEKKIYPAVAIITNRSEENGWN